MSYILDALKKSQAEQSGEVAQLQLRDRSGRSVSQWLLIGLAVLLGINASVMLWFFVFDNGSPNPSELAKGAQSSAGEARMQSTPIQQAPVRPTPRQTTSTQQANEMPRRVAQPITPPPTQKRQATTPQSMPKRVPTPIKAPTVARVDLQDLPESEQALYNGFKYSSHIFSPDDPSAGAIFINGQMLRIGDDFQELVVADITEFAVVFKETKDGKPREVEVVLADQWN